MDRCYSIQWDCSVAAMADRLLWQIVVPVMTNVVIAVLAYHHVFGCHGGLPLAVLAKMGLFMLLRLGIP